MEIELHDDQENLLENLKKQLALAVRSIQWSYAIFWSISDREPSVLKWCGGYYNGDIKTRKTVQSMDLNADRFGLQRSEQLRELYGSLSAAESGSQARRPSAALSPEDLTDTEWYYLVCMSFMFNIGQGLPGRTLANGRPIWLRNAHCADSKVFSRSLLAKSASIQTVVCFPFLRGVIELGVTELVLEDPSLIQHVKTSFLEILHSVAAKHSTKCDQPLGHADFGDEIVDTVLIPVAGCEELDVAFPINNANFQLTEDSFMVEGINGDGSQALSWQFVDDDFSNCALHSANSTDCISHSIVDPVRIVPGSNDEKADERCLQDVQDCNRAKLSALNLRIDDLHYQTVLSSLLKTSHPLMPRLTSQNRHHDSSFVSWKKVGSALNAGTPQKLLKKILFEVPRMHDAGLLESPDDNVDRVGVWRPEADDITAAASHMLTERKRREKINERFKILKSIIPSIRNVDKVSILDDTIEYLQELERKVEMLESCKDPSELDIRTKRKPQDAVERTSDNYGSKKTSNVKKPMINKRKACHVDEIEHDVDCNVSKDCSVDNVIVSVNDDNDVLIEIKCPWIDGKLLEIMDALSHLHLDSHLIQSSNIDGILSMTIKSKLKGLTASSAGTIKRVLQKVAG